MRLAAWVFIAVVAVACGIKGPPRPPTANPDDEPPIVLSAPSVETADAGAPAP